MAKYPASFETLEGVVRLNGELDFTDPASQPLGPDGGTIDGPVVVTPANKDDVAFAAVPVAGATADATDEFELYDDAGRLLGFADATGTCFLDLHFHNGTAEIRLGTSSHFAVRDPSDHHILDVGADGTTLKGGDNVTKLAADSAGLGFFGAATGAKPAVTGSKGANAALASLLTALATLGLITDSTT